MKLAIAIAQINVLADNPESNLLRAQDYIVQASKCGSDMIVFPEMFIASFRWARDHHDIKEYEHIIDRVAALAKKNSIWINGSMLIRDKAGRLFNSSILFDASGEMVGTYQKIHLFSLFKEDQYVVPGDHREIVNTPWGKIGLAICYDLRFPELFRSYALDGAGIVLVPSAFPSPRLEHWRVLLQARAIENQIFIVGANRVGEEDLENEQKVHYFGHSLLVDPWGDEIVDAASDDEILVTGTIDLNRIEEVRSSINILKDRRPKLYRGC